MMGAVQAIYDLPKPSIARVHGAAVGGGVGLMLACDFAVAASSARFGLTSVRNGLLAGIAIPVLIQAVGPRRRAPAADAWRHVRCRRRRCASAWSTRWSRPSSSTRPWRRSLGELKLGAPSVQPLIKQLVPEDRRRAAR